MRTFANTASNLRIAAVRDRTATRPVGFATSLGASGPRGDAPLGPATRLSKGSRVCAAASIHV